MMVFRTNLDRFDLMSNDIAGNVQSRIRTSSVLFLLAIALKQFYLFDSGSLQLGDLIFLGSVLSAVLSAGLSFRIEKKDFLLVAFVGLVELINIIAFTMYGSMSFLSSCLYYLFNLFVVLGYRYVEKDDRFWVLYIKLARAIFLFQLLLFAVGMGRWYDASRYMGTFNDPNQFGFYVLCVFFLQVFAKERVKGKGSSMPSVDDVLVFLLLITSLSTGMILGYSFYICLKYFYFPIKRLGIRGILQVLLAMSVGCLALFYALSSMPKNTGMAGVNTALVRIEEKLSKLTDFSVDSDYSDSIVADRNLDKIILYPEKLVFGAGEGGWDRFSGVRNDHEIHSTWLGILFCYGVAPFSILVAWVFANSKRGASLLSRYVEIAVVLEALTLANQRQPLFWILLAYTDPQSSYRGKNE